MNTHITIEPAINIPDCTSRLVTAYVNGDEAQVRVWPDGCWQLLRAEGDADAITDWSFAARWGVCQ